MEPKKLPDADTFMEILRKDFAENQRKYNERSPIRKLWDRINLRLFYWGIINKLNQ